MRSKLSKAAIAAVGLLALAGCGSGGGTTGAATSKLTPPKIAKLAALGTGEGAGQHRRLGRLRRGRLERPERRTG